MPGYSGLTGGPAAEDASGGYSGLSGGPAPTIGVASGGYSGLTGPIVSQNSSSIMSNNASRSSEICDNVASKINKRGNDALSSDLTERIRNGETTLEDRLGYKPMPKSFNYGGYDPFKNDNVPQMSPFSGINPPVPDVPYSSIPDMGVETPLPVATPNVSLSSPDLPQSDVKPARTEYSMRNGSYYPEYLKYGISVSDIDDREFTSLIKVDGIIYENGTVGTKEGGITDKQEFFSTSNPVPSIKFTIGVTAQAGILQWAKGGPSDKRVLIYTQYTNDELELGSFTFYHAYVNEYSLSSVNSLGSGYQTMTLVVSAESCDMGIKEEETTPAVETPEAGPEDMDNVGVSEDSAFGGEAIGGVDSIETVDAGNIDAGVSTPGPMDAGVSTDLGAANKIKGKDNVLGAAKGKDSVLGAANSKNNLLNTAKSKSKLLDLNDSKNKELFNAAGQDLNKFCSKETANSPSKVADNAFNSKDKLGSMAPDPKKAFEGLKGKF